MKLGFMYVAGEGIPQDYVEALKWFRLAADQGQANAQCFLGLMYFEAGAFHRTTSATRQNTGKPSPRK